MARKLDKQFRQAKSDSNPKHDAKLSLELHRLERICELMKRHELSEVEWEKGGEKIRLRARGFEGAIAVAAPPSGYPALSSQGASAAPGAQPQAAAGGLALNQKQILSPFVGTFYRAPSPNADYYVREGQTVKAGDTLCIIEAMKLMNEIEAEFPCKVVSVLVENGQAVEYGEPLFVVEA